MKIVDRLAQTRARRIGMQQRGHVGGDAAFSVVESHELGIDAQRQIGQALRGHQRMIGELMPQLRDLQLIERATEINEHHPPPLPSIKREHTPVARGF